MILRPYWQQRMEDAWSEAPIVWLAGVRRSGKTTLASSLGEERVLYVNCDLPSVEDMVGWKSKSALRAMCGHEY